MNTEQEFTTLIREYSRLIYKVCSIYAVEYLIGPILVIVLYVLAFGYTDFERIIGSSFFCAIFLVIVFRTYRNRIRNVAQSLRELEEFDSSSESNS